MRFTFFKYTLCPNWDLHGKPIYFVLSVLAFAGKIYCMANHRLERRSKQIQYLLDLLRPLNLPVSHRFR